MTCIKCGNITPHPVLVMMVNDFHYVRKGFAGTAGEKQIFCVECFMRYRWNGPRPH